MLPEIFPRKFMSKRVGGCALYSLASLVGAGIGAAIGITHNENPTEIVFSSLGGAGLADITTAATSVVIRSFIPRL